MNSSRAYWVYLVLQGIITLAQGLMFPVLAVYYVKSVGMNPLQLVLVGTVLEVTILLCEIPTGVVADTYSRRLSVIIGMFVLGLGWTIEGGIPLFAAILGAEVVRGFGETFLSGALDAWLADEVGEEHVGRVYLRSGQINRVIGIVGAVAAGGLASIRLNLPPLVGGGLFLLLGVFLIVAMPERGFQPARPGERATWRSMGETFMAGARVVRRSQTLTLLLIVSVFAGVSSEGFDRLWEAHLLTNFRFPQSGALEPVVWFSIISVAGNILSLISVEALRRRMERASHNPIATARVLLALNALTVVSIIVFGLAGNFALAVTALLAKAIIGSFSGPLYNAWLIQNTDAKVRATALSMISQTNALGQSVGGPGVGALGTVSLRAAMVVAGALFAPTIALFARILRHPAHDPAVGEAQAAAAD